MHVNIKIVFKMKKSIFMILSLHHSLQTIPIIKLCTKQYDLNVVHYVGLIIMI